MLSVNTLNEVSAISSSTLIGLAIGFVFSTISIFIQQFWIERTVKRKERQKIREESIVAMSKTFTKMGQPYRLYIDYHPFMSLNSGDYFKYTRDPLFEIFHKLPADISNKLYTLDQMVNQYEQVITQVATELENNGYLNELSQQEKYLQSLVNEDYGYFPSEDPEISVIKHPEEIDILRGKFISKLINEEENMKRIRVLEKELKEALEKEIDKYRKEIYK